MADFEFDVEPLRSLAQAGASAARGLPPDEVRRLGTRRRKRRLTVAASVATVMATALAGGAVAVVDQLGSELGLQPAGPGQFTEEVTVVTPAEPAPEPSQPTSGDPLPGGVIPANFPIDADMPDYGEDGQIEGPDLAYWYREISPCAAESFPVQIEAALVDAISVRLTAPEVEVFRGLWVFEDAADAEAVLQAYIDDLRACPTIMTEDTVVNFSVDKVDLGDESFMTTQSFGGRDGEPLLGLIQSALIRLGPAMLIVSEYEEAMPGTESEFWQQANVLDAAATLTAATCELIGQC